MYFNKLLSILLPLVFLTSCGLHIHEEHYSNATLKINERGYTDSMCSDNIDYEQFFKDFLLSKMSHIETHILTSNIFSCLLSKAHQFKDIVKGKKKNRFSVEEVRALLNIPHFKTSELKDIIDKVSKPPTLNKIMRFKDSLITTVSLSEKEGVIYTSEVCLKNDNQELRKEDINIFLGFLSRLPKEFKKIQTMTDELYPKILDLYIKSGLEFQKNYQENIANALVTELKKDFIRQFPHWSDVYSSRTDKKEQSDFQWHYPGIGFMNRVVKRSDLAPVLHKTFLLNDSFQNGEVRLKEDIQLMVLNLYFVNVLFNIYDVDKNNKLENEEVEKVSCLVIPFISIFSSDDSDGEGLDILNSIESWLLSPINIFDYVLHHQHIPKETFIYLKGLAPALFRGAAGHSISRVDLSRIMYLLFKRFFPMEYIYSAKEEESEEE